MKVCILGAGAIGSWIGAALANAGEEVCLVARGQHLHTIKKEGLRLVSGATEVHVRLRASEDPTDFGTQDIVFLTVKAHSLAAVWSLLKHLVGRKTVIVPAVNGIPWWYFYREGGSMDGSSLKAVDPDGNLFNGLDNSRVVGCVISAATEVTRPGVVNLLGGNKIVLGEPDNSPSERIVALADKLNTAGIAAETTTDIRSHIWAKLLGNVTHNPLCTLTLAHIAELYQSPLLCDVVRAMMNEAAAVAKALKVELPVTIEERMEKSRKLGPIKTSMRQDLENGRQLEVQAIIGTVIELAGKLGVPVPTIQTIYALTLERARHIN